MPGNRDNRAATGTLKGEMDHTSIENDQWAERYVMGRLPDDEKQRFEEHFVDCAKCLDDVEAADGLRKGLASLPPGEVPSASPSPAGLPPWFLAAAGLAVGVGLAAFFSAELRHTRTELADSQKASDRLKQSEAALQKELRIAKAAAAPSGAAVFTLNVTRGGQTTEPENRILLPKGSAWLVLQFDRPPGPEEAGYVVRISGADGKAVGNNAVPIGPVSNDTLAVTLPPGTLQEGDYTLAVEATSAPDVALATYRFRIGLSR